MTSMDPPNPTAIDMRHTKLKPEEAALIAGELVKPTWASRNEGIHERVSFEDTLWGFEMAGGAYYKTPLRVAYVRPGSRAEHACIRMGDTVLRINGRDTSTLTLQEAHQLVLDAGINLKIVVTSPDDKVNAHYDYEDPIVQEPELTPEQLKQMELERVRKALERASRCRELQWPWVRRKWIIYRESNCFMVPSKYENKNRDKFPELPHQRLSYFYPVEKTHKNKNSKNNEDNVKNSKEEEIRELEEDEEYEEVEEEVEEEEEIQNEELSTKQDGGERLKEANTVQEEPNNIIEHNEESLDDNSKNTNEEGIVLENSQRKDSDQSSTSNYELDNNNNHVAKTKQEQIDETNHEPEINPDDEIINEVAESSVEMVNGGNAVKTDDDILDSVLNDESEDMENER